MGNRLIKIEILPKRKNHATLYIGNGRRRFTREQTTQTGDKKYSVTFFGDTESDKLNTRTMKFSSLRDSNTNNFCDSNQESHKYYDSLDRQIFTVRKKKERQINQAIDDFLISDRDEGFPLTEVDFSSKLGTKPVPNRLDSGKSPNKEMNRHHHSRDKEMNRHHQSHIKEMNHHHQSHKSRSAYHGTGKLPHMSTDVISDSFKTDNDLSSALFCDSFDNLTHQRKYVTCNKNSRNPPKTTIKQHNKISNSHRKRPKQARKLKNVDQEGDLQYTFYIPYSDHSLDIIDGRILKIIVKQFNCKMTVHVHKNNNGIYYKGRRVIVVIIEAKSLVTLKKTLGRIDSYYPHFNARAFLALYK